MCFELILQAIIHESDYVQWSFIFGRTQNLEDINRSYPHIFQKFMAKNGKCKKLASSLVTILMSLQKNLATLIMHHGQLEKKRLQIKGVNRKQCRYKLARFTHLILVKDTKGGFQHIHVGLNILLCAFFIFVA